MIKIMVQSTKENEHVDRAQKRMDEVLRAKTPGERLAMADGMWRMARNIIIHHLRVEHANWNDEDILREAARRLSHGAV